MKSETIILIPCYKRFPTVKTILENYSKMNYDLLVFTQEYTKAQCDQLKKICPKATFVNFDKPMGVGFIRKSMFMYLFEVIQDYYKYVLMHDNDIIADELDIKRLEACLDDVNYNMASIDVHGILKDSDLEYIVSDALTGIVLFKYEALKYVWQKTQTMNNCEDLELVYLLGNEGILFNQKYCETKMIKDKTTLNNWKDDQVKSIEILKEKYGKDALDVFDRSNGQKIVKFKKTGKSKTIIFEGLDKSGKSTLVEQICDKTNNKHWVTDRGPLSWMVYDEFFGRNVVDKASFLNFIKANPDDILIVYCYASDKVLTERYEKHNHELIDTKAHKQLFEKYVNELAQTNHVLSVDTSKTSIQGVTNKVLNFIKQHE